jgi:Protein of unknown function DUF47
VKLRLLPPDRSFFDLFEAAGDNLAQTAALLRDLVEDYVDPETKARRLADCEHEGDRLTQALLVRLSSRARPPFDRDDVHALATRLDDVTDALEEAADLLVLHKVTEPIEAVVEQVGLLGQAAARPLRPASAGSAPWTWRRCAPTRPGSRSWSTPATASTAGQGPSCTRSRSSSRPATYWFGRTSSSNSKRH